MSTQVATQSRSAETPRGGKRGNKSRGGNAGARTARSNGGQKATGAAIPIEQSDFPQKIETAVPEPTEIVDKIAAVAVSEAGDMDVCWICAEPVKYYAVSECNHRTCHVCAIRLRALYKKMECTFCKEKQNSVIFTVSPEALFASFKPEDIPHKDTKLSVYFETQEMMEDSLLLLRFNCPDRECDYIGNGWGDLRLHVRATHGKLMCDLCIRFKKVFSHEHTIYLPGALPIHLPSMNQRPSKAALKEPPEGGIHPICEFCRECFFGDDELYAHMREKHEECFICKRNEIRDKYFQNYEKLEQHFNVDHYPCTQSECLTRKFVVFNSTIDLKAHLVEEHGGDMSSRDRKDARRVQADFTFEEVGNTSRHGRRDRDRDRDPPPRQQTPTQGPSSNTVGNPSRPPPAVSRRREGFGGALTEPGGGGPSTIPTDSGLRPSTPSPATVDIDPAVAERHAGFLNRLQALAPNPTSAVAAVKAATRGYRATETSARDLILTIWNVLDRNLDFTASIVNAFVDLVDEEDKKQDILSAWKGFAIEQRRQFPELTPVAIGSGYANITSGRVLNAKHATSPSSQSQQVWNRVALAASSSSNSSINFPPPPRPQERFPVLGGPSSSSTPAPTPGVGQGQRKTPWSGSSGAPAALRTQATPSRPSSTMASRSKAQKAPPKLSNSVFPELPTSSSARSKPQVKGNVSLKNILGSTGSPAVPAWNAPGSGDGPGTSTPQAQTQPVSDNSAEGPAVARGKKGKGKQKQTLFTLGSFPT